MDKTTNNEQLKQQPNLRKQQATRARGKNKHEEIGAEFGFDSEQFHEEGKFSTRNQPVSERTAWH
ncbi:MAG: hypothetical protein ABS949_03315 [Solibacillus sp.]